MDLLISIIFGLAIAVFVYFLINILNKISSHLRIIRLQLEIQNPLFVSEELLELDKNINYWKEKMWKYKDDIGETNKEIRDITFNLFWAYVEKLNHFRVMVAESKVLGNPNKTHEKYEKWLDKNGEDIRKMEKRATEINDKIKDEIGKRDLDLEFLGKWDTSEN